MELDIRLNFSPSQTLDQALANDLGPIFQIGKQTYALESDEEQKCEVRGGTVLVGSRKNLSHLKHTDPGVKMWARPVYQKTKAPDSGPNPYDHPDPLGK